MILHCDYCNSDMPETENWKCLNCGAGLKKKDNSIKLYPDNLVQMGVRELEVIDGELYAKHDDGNVYVWDGKTFYDWRLMHEIL